MRSFVRILGFALLVEVCVGFLPTMMPIRPSLRDNRASFSKSLRAYTDDGKISKKSWQDLAEQLADPFVSPFKKADIAAELLGLREDVAKSLSKVARREADVENEMLGTRTRKQLKAARAVQRQLVEDILPNAMNEIRSLRDRDTDVTKELKNLQNFLSETIDEVSAEGKFPQLLKPEELAKSLQQEARGIFLGEINEEQPFYTVVKTTEEYEIRDYAPMTLASRMMGPKNESLTQRSGRTFNALAGFLFGKNNESMSMEMTSPVFMQKGEEEKMSFVIPKSVDVPTPTDSSVTIEQVDAVRVAVRQFPGFATNKEVDLQKSELVQALAADGIQLPVDVTVTVAQYNPPLTIPTVRKNEVLIKIDKSVEIPTGSKAESSSASLTQSPASTMTTSASSSTSEPGWDEAEKPNKYLDEL